MLCGGKVRSVAKSPSMLLTLLYMKVGMELFQFAHRVFEFSATQLLWVLDLSAVYIT